MALLGVTREKVQKKDITVNSQTIMVNSETELQ